MALKRSRRGADRKPREPGSTDSPRSAAGLPVDVPSVAADSESESEDEEREAEEPSRSQRHQREDGTEDEREHAGDDEGDIEERGRLYRVTVWTDPGVLGDRFPTVDTPDAIAGHDRRSSLGNL